ncbi:hypothetical protein [Deinococcus frigens]|uniref:hypothetical protein n=1 Tax=Deinococcus frigens TaxID=249403 RepID=UPI0012EC0547|nr:hypothetical protein [Deinococcus frigens]
MTGRIELELEFLRRLLGSGEDGEAGVAVFPDAWPGDFPLRWPDLPGTRLWGSVRSAATRWTFSYGNRQQPPVARQLTRWRVCLDVAAPQPQVMETLRAEFTRQGWQAGQMWQQAFVEHAQTTWNAVHAAAARLLTLQTRGADAGALTQVWLTVEDQQEEVIGHWLGQRPHPHFENFDQAPLPTLSAPPGWQVVPQGGSGGVDRSESALLIPPEGQTLDLGALLASFKPQLAAQSWTVLPIDQQNAENSARLALQTPQGFGALGLDRAGEALSAKLVHMTFELPEAYAVSMYTLTST